MKKTVFMTQIDNQRPQIIFRLQEPEFHPELPSVQLFYFRQESALVRPAFPCKIDNRYLIIPEYLLKHSFFHKIGKIFSSDAVSNILCHHIPPGHQRFFFLRHLTFQELIKAASQILRLDWLQQIIGCAVCQSLPCIFKIRICTEDYHLCILIFLTYRFQKLQPVHSGHADVGHHQFRRILYI